MKSEQKISFNKKDFLKEPSPLFQQMNSDDLQSIRLQERNPGE